jgi:hypothetical protein
VRDDVTVLKRMRVLASENRRYGYLRLHAMLRREGPEGRRFFDLGRGVTAAF